MLRYEKWLDIPGHEGQYQVSDFGNVRAMIFRNRKTIKVLNPPRILKKFKRKVYWAVNLRGKIHSVHVLVLTVFIGPRQPGMQGAHLDGNPENNDVENLAWVTAKENCQHKTLHGTHQAGEKCPTSKLTNDQVKEIRRRRATGEHLTSIAKDFGVTGATVSDISRRVRWTHI